jgi:ankyrin repeat protein
MENIFKAVFTGDLRLISELLKLGIDIDTQDKDKRTPLIHAVIDNKIDIIKALIKNNANMNIQDSIGYSALHYAAQNYYIDIAKLLLVNNATVDIQDVYGNTPLFRAVFNSHGKGEMIDLLISYGANKKLKNKYSVSPLDLANTIGNYDIVKFLD